MNATLRSTSSPQVRSYPELQQQIHHDLLVQHPEWIDANGNCPTCEDYDRRLAELISFFQSGHVIPIKHAA